MKSNLNKTKRLAFAGIVCAVSLVVMAISMIIPMLDYTAPALAGAVLVAIVLEYNKRMAYLAYFVVAVMSLMLVANKSAAMLFTVLLGYYPILKGSIEQCKSRVVEWLIKLLIFNAIAGLSYLVMVRILGLVDIAGWFGSNAKYGLAVLLLAGNGGFVLYDYALTGVIATYIRRIKPRLKRRS